MNRVVWRGLLILGCVALVLSAARAVTTSKDIAITVTSAGGATTFTYNFLTGACVKTPSGSGGCNPMTAGVCNGTNDIALNDAAFHSFNSEAQRHVRPAETGWNPGGDGGVDYSASGAGNPYPDANINNQIVLNIPACNKIRYTFNRWGRGIRYFTMTGAGSSQTFLENDSNSSNFHLAIPYDGAMDYFGDSFYVNYNDYGWLIQTANAGATAVTLMNSAGAAQFVVGRWVLIMSYSQQQFGYPPFMRYYDWAKVTSIVGGVINFDTPLAFTHLSTRPYYGGTLADHPNNATNPAGQVGPARIVAIDIPVKPAGVQHNYSGLHLLSNPNWNTGALGNQSSAGVFTWQGLIDSTNSDIVSDEAVAMFMCRNLTISNSSWGFDEADKVVGTMNYVNVTAPITKSHSGELLFHMTGGHIASSNVAARNATYDGGLIIDGMLNASSGGYESQGINLDAAGQTINVTVNGVTFNGNNNTANHPIAGPQPSPYTFTVGSQITLPGGNGTSTIQMSKTLLGNTDGSTAGEQLTTNWGDGDQVLKNGSFVGTISSITGDASNLTITVAGTTFTSGDTVGVGRVQHVLVENSTCTNIGFSCVTDNISFGPLPDVTWTNNTGD